MTSDGTFHFNAVDMACSLSQSGLSDTVEMFSSDSSETIKWVMQQLARFTVDDTLLILLRKL